MGSSKLQAVVFGGSSGAVIKLCTAFAGNLAEVGGMVCCGETFGDLLEHGREAVVGFVAGCPDSVAAAVVWGFDDFEDAVVGGDGFEGDADNISFGRR